MSFSVMPQVWTKYDVPNESYGNFPKTYWFLASSHDQSLYSFPHEKLFKDKF